MEMKLKTGFCLGSILLLFAACSSKIEPSQDMLVVEQLKLIFNKNEVNERIDPRKVITRSMIDESNIPLILIEIVDENQIATLSAFPGSTLNEVWLSADGRTVTTQNGMLIGTRGMNYDLMGADVGAASYSLEKTISGKREPHHRRLFKYLAADNQDKIIEYSCVFSKESQETIFIFEKPYKTLRVSESCESGGLQFKNTYWVEKNGMIRKSQQWHGQNIGLILIERVI
jgi:hypothetical protein